MKKFIHPAFGALVFLLLSAPAFSQNFNLELRSTLDFTGQKLANICGWTAPDGREYALVGANQGLVIVEVTNPATPVQIVQIPGPTNDWKEIKTYGHYAYVTTEGGGGVQIVDLSGLPSATLNYHSVAPSIQGQQLNSIHALHIDTTKGFLYLFGSNLFSGGPVIMNLNPDPYNPVYAGKFDQLGYVHDGYVDNDTLYACHIYTGLLSVVDMANKAAPVVLGTVQTPGAFTHNAWLLGDRKHILTTDEAFPSFVTAYDISDPSDMIELDRVSTNDGNGSIGHNVHVLNDWAITSWYTDGVVIIDAHQPDNLVIVGRYDTWAQGGQFSGNWGAYPYFPSGTIVASNINPGRLFVLTPSYQRASYLEGVVINGCTGLPLAGASVTIAGGTTASTGLNGIYKTGLAGEGAYDVTVSAPGFPDTTVSVTLVAGQVTTLNLEFDAGATVNASGLVISADNQLPVANTTFQMTGTNGNFSVQTDADGLFNVTCLPAGTYRFAAWGFLPQTILVLPDATSLDVQLQRGYYDDFELDLGWTNQSTAASGDWELGVPVGTTSQGQTVNPGTDADGDSNDQAYVTGNGGGNASDDDVDNGQVTLITPSMNLAGATDAVLTFQYWFYNGGGQGTPNDQLEVRVTNGLTTVSVFTETVSESAWRSSPEIHLGDFLPLTGDVQLQFITADQPQPNGHLVEAGIDIVTVTPAPSTGTGAPIDPTASLIASPNPTTTHFALDYRWLQAQNLELDVRNAAGQTVNRQTLGATTGRLELGANWPAGVYFAVLRNGARQSAAVRLVKN